MKIMNYDIHSDFDIEKHKQTFIDYLEVLILHDGSIVYAVPSHVAKAEQICCDKFKVSRDELICKLCPEDMCGDYIKWLLNMISAVAVWNRTYICGDKGLNIKQRAQLKRLKLHGLYKGAIG